MRTKVCEIFYTKDFDREIQGKSQKHT